MGLLRLLGIEKYLKKVKTYVDEENVKDRAYTDKKVSENKTATPDWDAESWEAGHIKNRTHYSRNIILQSNESNGKYTYYLDFYESDDTTTAWLSFYDITESRTREISLSELNGFVVDLGYARITFSLVLDQNEGAYYVAVESNTGTVDSRIVDSIAIQTVDKPLNQGFIPDTIARTSQIPEGDTTKWNSVDRDTLMNELDSPITSDDLARIGFNLEYLAQPQKHLKGIVIEDNFSNLGNAYLALTYFVMHEGVADHICFGHINRNDSGAELEIYKDSDGRWMIQYTEA